MIRYSEDKKVSFDKNTHSYFLGEKRLKSVTSFLYEFKNEFDSDKWSKKIALRDGKTQSEVLSEWAEKSKKSCDIGTAIHKIFEDYTNGNFTIVNEEYHFDLMEVDLEYILDFNTKSITAIKLIKDFFATKRLIPIHTEYIVYDNTLAGQIDMVCKDKKDNIYILDFKTNTEISVNSYGKKMKGIFSEFDDCSFYHYSLQLSLYKKLIKKYKIKDMFLIHITNEDYKFIQVQDILTNINLNKQL